MTTHEAISLYLAGRAGKLADRTLRQLKGTLAKLPDVDLADHTEETLDQWLAALPVSAASKNTYADRVRGFFTYCKRKGLVIEDPSTELGGLVEPAILRKWLRNDQLAAMLDSAPNPRDRAALAVACEWLLRASEIARLRVGHIRLDDGMADVQIMKKKGVWSWDEMPITDTLSVEIVRWLGDYRKATGIVGTDSFLFPNLNSLYNGTARRITYSTHAPMSHPEKVIHRALDAIGVTADRRGFHDVRRSMARLRYDALCEAGDPDPLGVVKALLHHEDRRTTEGYIGIDAARTRRNKVMRSAAWAVSHTTSTSASTDTSGLAKVIPITS
jgi:integrase